MFLYKIAIAGLSELEGLKEDELSYFFVLADSVSDIEKWMDRTWGKDYGLCLNYVEFLQNMEEYNASEI